MGIKIEKLGQLTRDWWKENIGNKGRVTGKDELHITLTPPWYTNDAEEELQRLIGVERVPPFEVIFDQISYGPDPHKPRLVWATGRAPEDLCNLKDEIDKRLGRKKEKRNYLLHTTLGRFSTEEYMQFKVKNLKQKINWRVKINSFQMLESHLFPTGAKYEVLAEFNLDK